jgi:hypothetical protein
METAGLRRERGQVASARQQARDNQRIEHFDRRFADFDPTNPWR